VFRKKYKKPSTYTIAIDNKDAPLSLRLIKGVLVLVEDLPPKIEKKGLTSDQIQAYIEAKCKRAGIQVLSNKESLKVGGYPILAVIVDIKKIQGNGHYLYAIHVDLHQNVHLERDPRIMIIGATTWESRSFGMCKDFGYIRAKVKDHVEEFTKTYLSANPKLEQHFP
jgi:hypothetical protein